MAATTFAFGSAIRPASPPWTTQKCLYWRECVTNESNAADAWKKKYSDRLGTYDALYKHIPGMQRCIAGIDTLEGLQYVESGGLTADPRPKSVAVHEMSQKSYVNRPKSGAQKVGYGGLGVHSDFIEPSRAADTIYERDFCVRVDDFKPHIKGMKKTRTFVDGPWRKPGQGTMAVIPTKWQFPPGTKQPEGFLVRSELRKLRLEKEKNKAQLERATTANDQQIGQMYTPRNMNPMKGTSCLSQQTVAKSSQPPPVQKSLSLPKTPRREMVRKTRPVHSRSWAPPENTAPKGWYKTELGPGRLRLIPGEETVLNTPQARLNVLKRRIDERAAVMESV